MKNGKVKSCNDFSIKIIGFLGNNSLAREQTSLLEDLIKATYAQSGVIASKTLSPREQSCLCLAAIGKSAKETAVILKIKLSTVMTYRKEIIRKLNCKNITQAVFNGVLFGFVNDIG